MSQGPGSFAGSLGKPWCGRGSVGAHRAGRISALCPVESSGHRRTHGNVQVLPPLIGVAVLGFVFASCDAKTPTTSAPAPATPVPPAQPRPPPPPPVPTGLRVSATTPDSITWTWTAVEGATAYEVQLSADEVFDDTDAIVTTTATSHTVTGLSPESGRHLRVRSIAGTAETPIPSAWSSHVTGMSAKPPAPPVPTGLRVSAIGSEDGYGFVEWSWEPVEGATGYEAQLALMPDFGTTLRTSSITETKVRFFVDPETPAWTRVRSTRDRLTSDWTAPVMGESGRRLVIVPFEAAPLHEVTNVSLNQVLPLFDTHFVDAAGEFFSGTRLADWSSSNPEVMRIGETRTIAGYSSIPFATLLPVATGQVTITATVSGLSAYASFHVSEPFLLSDRRETDRPDDITGPQIHAVYAIPSDGVDEYRDLDGTLSAVFESIQEWMGQQTGKALRIDTYQGRPDITFLQLGVPHPPEEGIQPDFGTIIDALEANIAPDLQQGRGEGCDSRGKMYVVFYFFNFGYRNTISLGGVAQHCGPVAAVFVDANRFGLLAPPRDGRLVGSADGVAAHELMHLLGAAPSCAPNVHDGSHVMDDPRDVLYTGRDVTWWSERVLDVARDDYFGHGRSDCLDIADSRYLRPVSTPFTKTPEPPRLFRPDEVFNFRCEVVRP